MPLNKKPKTVTAKRLDRINQVQDMFIRGLTQEAIARHFKVTEAIISQDVAIVRDRLAGYGKADNPFMLGRELATLDAVRREAWQALEKSKEERRKVTTETLESARGGYTKEQVVREMRLAEAEYMRVILDTSKQICTLLGLEAPKRLSVRGAMLVGQVGPATDGQGAGFSWEALCGAPPPGTTPADGVERMIEGAGKPQPPPEVILSPGTVAGGG